MTNIKHKIKSALSTMHEASRALNAMDEDFTALDGLQATLDATKAELAQTENRLEQIRAMVVEDDAKHSAWCEATTRERQRVNAEIDKAQQRLRELEAVLEEKQAQYNSIVGGMRALQERLGV
jgi:chromosome segregation ATPase